MIENKLKYQGDYTPELKELHIGMGYWNDGEWEIIKNLQDFKNVVENKNYEEKIKITYLYDRDLYNQGWIEFESEELRPGISAWNFKDYILYKYKDDFWIHKWGKFKGQDDVIFRGKIKNLNEFIKLMEMLGIK